MPIPKTSLKELKKHLLDLGLKREMNITIHSNMLSFGHIEDGLDGVYNTIRNIIGTKGTIVVPTYTTSLKPNQVYDPLKTTPQTMGVFSNYIMHKQSSARTSNPVHSHAIEGPLKNVLLATRPDLSIGPGSIFEKLQEEGFYLLLLGCSFQQGATFLHHVEACNEVFYRTWIDLERKIVQLDGSIKKLKVKYYGRKNNISLKTNFEKIENLLQISGVCHTKKIRQTYSHMINLSDLFHSTKEILSSNPNILIVKTNAK